MKKILISVLILCASVTTVNAVDYGQFDVNDINAANKAVKAYQKEYSNKKRTVEADVEYEKFWDFYLKFNNNQSQKVYLPYEIKNSSIASQLKNYSKKYYKYGLIAQFDEGEIFLVPSKKYLYENFKDFVTIPKMELLKFDVQFDKRVMYDLRYTVSKKKLKQYKQFYEKFNNKYLQYSKEHKIYEFIEYYDNKLKNYPNVLQ